MLQKQVGRILPFVQTLYRPGAHSMEGPPPATTVNLHSTRAAVTSPACTNSAVSFLLPHASCATLLGCRANVSWSVYPLPCGMELYHMSCCGFTPAAFDISSGPSLTLGPGLSHTTLGVSSLSPAISPDLPVSLLAFLW